MKKSLAVLTGFLLWLPVALVAAANPAGVWEGTLKMPNGDLGFVFNLHRDGDQWAAEVDVPAQGVSGMPLDKVKVDGATIAFSLPGPGDPHYDGKLSDDGKTITGNFTQGAGGLPLELKWKSEPRAVAKAPANSGEIQVLEGAWEGTLDVNGSQLHLRFHFTKNADGSMTGTLDSVDQGVNGLPITAISRTGDTVKLDVRTISGAFEGSLNKEATTMTGTWTQGPGSLPLILQRKSAEKKS